MVTLVASYNILPALEDDNLLYEVLPEVYRAFQLCHVAYILIQTTPNLPSKLIRNMYF